MTQHRSGERRPMLPEDLVRFRMPSEPRVSPDGRRVAFVVRETDPATAKPYRRLCLLDVETHHERALTSPGNQDHSPRWSPDGATIAFISDRAGGAQIWTIPADGGPPTQLTTVPHEASQPDWSPDGRSICFVSRVRPGEEGKTEGAGAVRAKGGEAALVKLLDASTIETMRERSARPSEGPNPSDGSATNEDSHDTKQPPPWRDPLRVTRLRYKADGLGFLEPGRDQIWIASFPSGEACAITSGEWDNGSPAFSPDGKTIAFVSNRTENADRCPDLTDIFTVPATGGETRKITDNPGPAMGPSWSPDGRWIAHLANDHKDDGWGLTNIFVRVIASGGGAPIDITRGMDRTAMDLTISDMKGFDDLSYPPLWSADGRSIFFLASDRGSCHLYRATFDPAAGVGQRPDLTQVTDGREEVASFHGVGGRAGSSGERFMVMARLGPDSPGEIWSVDGGAVARLTGLNDALMAEMDLFFAEEVTLRSADGTPIQGWVIRPRESRAGKRVPLVLMVHGGPHAQYGWVLFHEFQVLAAHGYGVLFTNPRGSQGYGEAFASAIKAAWGSVDYEDVMAAADWAATQDWVDSSRLAIAGGSYGGYMTNWVIGHTDRFRAAVTMRSVSNLMTMYGCSDGGPSMETEFDGPWWEREAQYREQSPITYVTAMKTPLLILHSEEDHRCPVEQAEQLYTALKAMGREVEMVRFPGEGHNLSRTGQPLHRLQRLSLILDWFGRHL